MTQPLLPRFRSLLAVVGSVLMLPFLIPYFLIETAIADRRRKRLANDFPCAQCGDPLGYESVALADAAWRDHVRQLRDRYPGALFRLVRTVWAICPSCGLEYVQRWNGEQFELVPREKQ